MVNKGRIMDQEGKLIGKNDIKTGKINGLKGKSDLKRGKR